MSERERDSEGYVFLTLAFTEPRTLCFNNPVNTRKTERHTVDGGGRTFPNHLGVPYCPLSRARLVKERTRISIYNDTGKEMGAADWAFIFLFFWETGQWGHGGACAWLGSEDIWAGVPAALLLGLPVSSFVDVRGLSCHRVDEPLKPHRRVVVLMTTWSHKTNTHIQKHTNGHLIKEQQVQELASNSI